MTGYVIKGTYTGGKNTGREFILMRNGYVKGSTDVFFEDEVYKSERIAKMVATKYNKSNAYDVRYHSGVISPCRYECIAVEI